MEVNPVLLEQIAVDVLNGMLGMNAVSEQTSPLQAEGLTASIRISGDWHAGLEVLTTRQGAARLAEQMFGTQMTDLTEGEVADALGEITNMIGGNIKGLTQGDTQLSLPCVGTSIPADGSPPATVETSMRFGNEPILLRMQTGG
jgi:chemotaxis protein CheX